LKTALAPTTSGRKHEVLNQYTALKVYNKKQSIEKWLNNWRNVYKLAEQLKLPDVQEFRAHYDFVQAIKPISSSFAGALEVDLIRKERKEEPAPSIIDLIEEFKEHYRMQQVASSTSTANNSAFTTLGNSNSNIDSNNSNSNSNLNSNLRWNKKCIYGFKYRFSDCYYIAK
jgi:hypothetical protein